MEEKPDCVTWEASVLIEACERDNKHLIPGPKGNSTLNCIPLGPLFLIARAILKSDEREADLKLQERLLPELYDARSNF